MAVGPCDLIVVKFPGNKFRGEIAPAIAKLHERGIVHVIDALFAMKDEKGDLAVVELQDLDDDGVLDVVAAVEVSGAIGPEDVELAADGLEPNSSALLLLFENTWAAEVTQAMRNADGELLFMERIPAAVVEQALAEHA